MEWWKELGFDNNPFDIKPNPNLVGIENEEKKIIKAINSGIPIHVYGEIGTGKTSLAKRLEKFLGKKYITIYLSGEVDPNPDIVKIIRKRKRKFFFFTDKRKVIAFLDECQGFSEEFMKKVKYLFDEGILHSFVTFQIERVLKNIPPSMADRFYLESVQLKPPPAEEVKKVIEMRTKGKIKIEDKALDIIIKMNKNNVRGVLKTLNYIFSKIGPKKEVSVDDVMRYLPETVKQEETKEIRLSQQQQEIAERLLQGPKTIKELEEELGIRKETIAKQLSRMIKKGYVIKRREGRKVYYLIRESAKRLLVKE